MFTDINVNRTLRKKKENKLTLFSSPKNRLTPQAFEIPLVYQGTLKFIVCGIRADANALTIVTVFDNEYFGIP